MTEAITSSTALIDAAVSIARQERRKTVAVAAAHDLAVMEAVAEAHAEGFLDGILIGDEKQIKRLASEYAIDISELDLIEESDPIAASHAAVKLISEKQASVIMKGFVASSALLKVVLDRRYGLRGANSLSHCAVLDIPGYHKLLNVTDGGMVVKPSPEQKYEILENAVMVARALGVIPVKVAVSGGYSHPTEKMPHTISDMDSVIPRARKNLQNVIVRGPLSFDMAVFREGESLVSDDGEVLGDADVYLVDSIEEGNILSKTLIQFSQAVFAGVVVGARAPISLVSRTDTAANKKASLAVACLLADYYLQNGVWES